MALLWNHYSSPLLLLYHTSSYEVCMDGLRMRSNGERENELSKLWDKMNLSKLYVLLPDSSSKSSTEYFKENHLQKLKVPAKKEIAIWAGRKCWKKLLRKTAGEWRSTYFPSKDIWISNGQVGIIESSGSWASFQCLTEIKHLIQDCPTEGSLEEMELGVDLPLRVTCAMGRPPSPQSPLRTYTYST